MQAEIWGCMHKFLGAPHNRFAATEQQIFGIINASFLGVVYPLMGGRRKMGEETKQKVYLETSFVSYLTGRATTREPIALWQVSSRQWREVITI